MGKSILIVVLGMSVLVGFFILKLSANSKENLATTVNMFEQTQARLIANSGIEIYLEKLKEDNSIKGQTFTNNSLFGGSYDVTLAGPDTAIMVTSTATFIGVTHKSVAVAQADKLPDFTANSSLYVSTKAIGTTKITGNITIDGHNHDLNGTKLIGNEVPGIAVDLPEQIQPIIDNISGSAIVDGLGGIPSVHATTNFVNWQEYALDVESNPDIIINSSQDLKKYSNLGTIDNPKTTFINGDIQISSGIEGCGILVVNGNLTINSDFTYRGLLISYQESDISTQLNGNGKIIGATIVAGESANLYISNGTFKSLYSQAALNLINGLLSTRRFRILSWWE